MNKINHQILCILLDSHVALFELSHQPLRSICAVPKMAVCLQFPNFVFSLYVAHVLWM